jgi:two-component system chemotaxis response regulator CheY
MATGSMSGSHQLTVLLVDDSATARALIKVALMGRSFSFLEAEDGEQALAISRSNHVDLIISDYQMPRMDGLSLVQKLRGGAVSRARAVPIIVLSSEKNKSCRTDVLAAGANAFVSKPVSSSAIAAAVDRLVARAGA